MQKRILDSYWNKLLSKFCIAVGLFHARVQSLTWTIYEKCIMAVLTPKSVTIQLTAFKAFKTDRKLNSVSCNFVHFSHQPLVLSLKREFFPSLLSNNSHTMHRLIIFMRTNQDQIFDDDIDEDSNRPEFFGTVPISSTLSRSPKMQYVPN